MRVITLIILLLIPIQLQAKENTVDNYIKENFTRNNAVQIIRSCNKYAKNPKHCKIVKSFVAKAESNNCKNAYKHNCFWNSKYKFNSDIEAIIQFNKTYNKYYWKNSIPSDFYRPVWTWKHYYCTSEESSNTKNGCPNWAKVAWQVYNKLKYLK